MENVAEFLENNDNNLTYYEIPTQLACAYLKGHLTGRVLDWFEVLGYRVIEDKATDYAHLKQALTEQFPVVRNRSELDTRFYASSQKHNQKPSDFVYDLLKIHKQLKLERKEEKLLDHVISRLECQILDYVENVVADVLSRNPLGNMDGSQISCAALRALALNSREQLLREQREDPELRHIYRYLENPDDGSINATVCEGPYPASRPERHRFISVITDHFTKWSELIPLRKASAQAIAKALFENYISRYGALISLISDNGPQFISDVFEHLSHRSIKSTRYKIVQSTYRREQAGARVQYDNPLETRTTRSKRHSAAEGRPVRSRQTTAVRPCPYYLRSHLKEPEGIPEAQRSTEIDSLLQNSFRRRSLGMEALDGDPTDRSE
ncbi:uncharacterized protein TNCV_4665641 [Trichonephila clavipes]|nr:uncharacterized protein TNCV_4665641 [Trichonephila clavipes]